jgi:hypothetical protein
MGPRPSGGSTPNTPNPTPGAALLAGGMTANGSIEDQNGQFTFVSVSAGDGFIGGGSYS